MKDVHAVKDAVEIAYNLKLTQDQMSKLVRYVGLLQEWSNRVRLISRGDLPHIWDRHIVDCLALINDVSKETEILDFGSGAGLPGIPLALILHETSFILLEPARMKALFLNHCVKELNLANVKVLRSRSEELSKHPDHLKKYPCVTARAVAALPKLWEYVNPILHDQGRLIALKGPNPLEEFEGQQPQHLDAQIREYVVPMSGKQRSIIILRRCFT